MTGASTANGARVQLYSSNNTNAQKYRFESIGNGTYKIINANSGKVLDVAGGSTANGAALQQYTSNNTVAQQWTVRNYGSGRIALVSVNANKAVDVPGGNSVQQAQLQLYFAEWHCCSAVDGRKGAVDVARTFERNRSQA